LIDIPVLEVLNEVGNPGWLCFTTVVVTDRVVVDPLLLAITSAIIPPATAPPMIGIHRLGLLMLWLSSPYENSYVPRYMGPLPREEPFRVREEIRKRRVGRLSPLLGGESDEIVQSLGISQRLP
jgi:hypothetical protein